MPPTEKRNIGSYQDTDILDSIGILISECFQAMALANALAGAETTSWEIIHNYKIDEIFAEAKHRKLALAGLKMAVGTKYIEDTWAKKYL